MYMYVCIFTYIYINTYIYIYIHICWASIQTVRALDFTVFLLKPHFHFFFRSATPISRI